MTHQEQTAGLQKALAHARAMIENYQSDIASLVLPAGAQFDASLSGMRIYIDDPGSGGDGQTLADVGFCQGRISAHFKEALAMIKRLEEREER